MDCSRRQALAALAAASGAGLAALATPGTARADATRDAAARADGAAGLLYDATLCIGCKACMVACNRANDLAPDTRSSDGRTQVPLDLNEHTKNIIKLCKDEASGATSFVKRQCMHCVDPACAAACMLGALQKREHGIVSYRADLCVGCRYCEIACPFNVPKFQWEERAPKIVKCELCRERIDRGEQPACSAVCPTHAVIYGARGELLAEAHARLAAQPGRYVPRVYGEHEGGGTQVLYLSHLDFAHLGLPDLDERPVPDRVRTLQRTVYQGFIAPVVLYGALAAVLLRNQRRAGKPDEPDATPHGKDQERT